MVENIGKDNKLIGTFRELGHSLIFKSQYYNMLEVILNIYGLNDVRLTYQLVNVGIGNNVFQNSFKRHGSKSG